MMRLIPGFLGVFFILATLASAATDTVTNPTKLDYEKEPVRLKVDAPGAAGTFTVLRDGKAVPYQVQKIQGRDRIWVSVDLASGESAKFQVKAGQKSPDFDPAIQVKKAAGNHWLDNGAIQLAAMRPVKNTSQGGAVMIRAGDGPSLMFPDFTAMDDPIKGVQIEVVNGPIFSDIVLTGMGEKTDQPYRARLRVLPDRPYVIITEHMPSGRESGGRMVYGFDLTEWKPDKAIVRRWYSGQFRGAKGVEQMPLKADSTRVPDAIVNLQPRWTQSYDEAWFAGVSDGEHLVAALPIRAGNWVWPHNNLVTLSVDDKDRPSFTAPILRGSRQWLLLSGKPELADQAMGIATKTCFVPLDKLHNDYVLTWEGLEGKAARPISPKNFYSNQTNPTDMIRRAARSELKKVGSPAKSLQALYEAQAYLDPDWYGTYENYWSPINPNFYSDFMKLGIAKAARVRTHPEFERIRKRAEARVRADVAHSVTLPGGAGQECPGYQHHGTSQWAKMADVYKKYLGFDPRTFPQWKASGHFLAHVSVPNGADRREYHPGGDTHPGRPDPRESAKKFGYSSNPKSWKTEELPGFGVIFRHNCGTGDETYLAFKSGPNRGHYHGDSLSFHLSFNARDTAVDHRVSYHERPGQEHMHNRVAFSSERFEYANMDGHERVIAFEPGERADITVGQVSSPRLRKVKPLPPEDWDVAYPQQQLKTPLRYRRTIVQVKKGDGVPDDFFVIRDEFWSDPADKLSSHYHIHVKGGKPRQDGRSYSFGSMSVFDASAQAAKFTPFHWTPKKDKLKGEATHGLRLSLEPNARGYGEFITVLYPGGKLPETSVLDHGVKVGAATVRFEASKPAANGESSHTIVEIDGKRVAHLAPDQIDLDRSQGRIGLFIPDVGYPFGPIPQWLIDQRAGVDIWKLTTP